MDAAIEVSQARSFRIVRKGALSSTSTLPANVRYGAVISVRRNAQ